MQETKHFVNEGYGWTCKRCRGSEESSMPPANELPRYFREGEAEEKETRLSSQALARWRYTPRGRVLFCPRCGAEEEVAE